MLAAAFPDELALGIVEGRVGVSRRPWAPAEGRDGPGWLAVVSRDHVVGVCRVEFRRCRRDRPEGSEEEDEPMWEWRYSEARRFREPDPWDEVPGMPLGLAVVPEGLAEFYLM